MEFDIPGSETGDMSSKTDLEFNAPDAILSCPYCQALLKVVHPKVINGVPVKNLKPDERYEHDVEACALERGLPFQGPVNY